MGDKTQAMPDQASDTRHDREDGVNRSDAGGRTGAGESGGGAYKDPDQAQGDGLHDDPGTGREGFDENDPRGG